MATLGKQLIDFIDKEDLIIPDWGGWSDVTWDEEAEAKINEWLQLRDAEKAQRELDAMQERLDKDIARRRKLVGDAT